MKGTVKQTRKFSPQPSGFTLLEMIVVIGIIALILGAAAAVIGRGGASAEIKMTQVKLEGINGKLMEYKMLGGMYPSQAQGLQALITKPSMAPVPRNYTKLYDDLPLDAWDKEFKYAYPGSKDATKPEVISSGPDGQFGTDDDLSSQK